MQTQLEKTEKELKRKEKQWAGDVGELRKDNERQQKVISQVSHVVSAVGSSLVMGIRPSPFYSGVLIGQTVSRGYWWSVVIGCECASLSLLYSDVLIGQTVSPGYWWSVVIGCVCPPLPLLQPRAHLSDCQLFTVGGW